MRWSDVDFELAPGEVHVLFGENGAGKSTLISILAGANQPTRGRLYANGAPITFAGVREARARGISAVFQEFSLVPQLTVAENLFLGAEPTAARHPRPRRRDQARARRSSERLGFPLRADRQVQYLSRAEQQMVEIAKAFRTDLSVLILDEPTASLTERETEQLFALIAQAKARGRRHHLHHPPHAEIRRIGDRITVLRDGRKVGMMMAADADETELIRMMSGRLISQIFPKVELRSPARSCCASSASPPATAACATSHRGARRRDRRHRRPGRLGKSEVARACYRPAAARQGQGAASSGEDVTGATPRQMLDRGFFYLPPDRHEEGLVLIRSSVENIVAAGARISANFSQRHFPRPRRASGRPSPSLARDLKLQPFDIDRAVGTFSGGNQQKVLLGKMLTRDGRAVRLRRADGRRRRRHPRLRSTASSAISARAGRRCWSSPPTCRRSCISTNRAYVFYRGHVQAKLAGEARSRRIGYCRISSRGAA